MNRHYARIETWTVEDLIDATSPSPRSNRKVTIPEFQRRLTWDKKRQERLIRSIKRGYPFGSLLMYRVNDDGNNVETYKLIDGLQRTHSLRAYMSHPHHNLRKSDVRNGLVALVASALNPLTTIDCLSKRYHEKIRGCILNWLWDSQGFTESSGWSVRSLTESLLRDVIELSEESFEFYEAIKRLLANDSEYYQGTNKLLNSVRRESDIGKAEIPVIVFTGRSKDLAEVFELLNTQGKSLDRYEVFAAQWLEIKETIRNSNIIDAIWKKYAELERLNYTLDISIAAPNKESRRTHRYTLFEYLFGLGQLLCQEFPYLFKPEKKPDKPSSYGFNLMSACLGLGVTINEVKKLPDAVSGLDRQRLESNLIESIEYVSDTLQSIISLQPEGYEKVSYYHAENQIVSMIATAFQVRYDKRDLRERDGWIEKRERLAKHLPMYLLSETLRGDWRGSGDSRLHDFLQYHRYLDPPPTKTLWQNVLDTWFDDHMRTRKQTQRYVRHEYPEYLFLRYIFARRISRVTEYKVSHVVPTLQLQRLMRYAYDGKGPLNTIGNLALVAATEKLEQGDRTFVEYLNERRRIGAIRGPGRFNDERTRYEKLLLCKADMFPSELTKEAFEAFLRKRFELLKREFLTVWSDHIPADPQT